MHLYMATYKKNFLSSVIFRIDFDEIELGQLSAFSKKIKTSFPITEQKDAQEFSGILDSKTGVFNHSNKKKTVWQFFNSDKSKLLEIDNNFIVLSYSKYKDSSVLIKDIEDIFSEFIKQFEVKTIRRIGLRYRNDIDMKKEPSPLKWDKYISKDLISNLKFIESNKIKTSRSLGQIIVREDDAYITFNYGLTNRDYPNEIVKKEFLLDYDCVSKFPTEIKDFSIIDVVKKYNKYVEDLFELSITDGLRVVLNKK